MNGRSGRRMTDQRSAPYSHFDGTPCWTPECKRGNTSLVPHLNPQPLTTPPTRLMTLANIAQQYVPRNLDQSYTDYYNATDLKHFGNHTEPGSKFLDPSLQKLGHVLMLRMRQTDSHNLDGDDTAALLARGSDPTGFMDGNRYLMVLTPGTVGIKHSSGLSAGTKLQVARTKPGVPCSLVLRVKQQPTTDYAVIIISKHEMTGKDFVITAFPGPVTRPTVSEELDKMEDRTLTVSQAREILGTEFWANTRINSVG